MSHKPVFLFVFANDVAQSLQLDKEWREAEYALQKDEDAGKIIFNLTPKATLDDIWDKFNRFHNQVAIFHYGGHSNNEVLDLEDTSLEGKSLATLVGQEQNLKLVFLNGCANAGLVELLFKQSIPAVIATTAVINDQRAINLSKHFYIALSNGKTIKEAFFTAASYVNNGEKEVLVDYRGGGALQEKQQFEWGLYVQDESILDWRIGTATSNLQKIVLHRLRQISRGRYKKFASKGGRFYSLEIRDAILAGIKNIKKHHRQFIEEHVSLDGVSQSFAQSVSLLWQKNCSHAMIIGAGGMGKTVSLLRLWKQWTNTESHYCPVPIFIQLNEFNYRPEKDFIRNYIQEHYGGVNINELIRVSNPDSNNQHSPQIILLLDGLNEVTAQSNELILEINQLKTQENFPGLQIVLTSRTDLRATHQWQVFHLLELQALTTEQIDNYLEKQIPSDIRLIELLGNPMMLSIYAAQSNLPQRYYDKSLLKEQITSTGEMLYNVEAVQRIKIEEQFATEPREQIFRRFVLEFVVPYTAWNMQQSGVFSITEQDAGDIPGLITLLSRIKKELLDPDFFRFFKSFRKLDEDDSFQGIKDWKLIEKIIDQICCEELVVLVNENETYRFLHQNFRDYFAARHVQNQMSLAIKKKALPDVLRQAPLGFYVRQILGELEGEHYNKLVWLENEKQWSNDYPIQNNHIAKQIELCRNVFDQGQLGYTAWNILTIWKEQRKELSSANLHKLHFFDFTFNTVRSSRPGLAARLSRGKLDKENLFPQGHSDNVTNAVYSSNDNRIITASDDRTAKVWDVQSGTCILTLKGHTENISKATCSLDSSRIITASDDRTAKVWDTQSGSCILTLEGHKDWVNDVVYSPDGNQIITASEDRTIKVWDAQSGTCILTLEEHFTSVNSVAYSPDGNQIITASKDRTAKIWDVQSGTCILTLEGHTKEVNSATYSSDGYQIVTTSDDGTAKVWDVQSVLVSSPWRDIMIRSIVRFIAQMVTESSLHQTMEPPKCGMS
ncbi:MAG: NACHT domain-containing protein, partial [Bacteroidota bacterium]